ncbi:MAG: hypothetical protein EOO88_21740 [Pedobacter sp.]|nr:MAG: hypothetical protein EOO88_21740 [Pedobacter sp.]
MATVATVLKTTKKLSNNEYAVAIRVTHERLSKYIAISTLVTNQSLKWRCSTDTWKAATEEDNGLGKFRKAHPSYKDCNSILEIKLKEANNILNRYDEQQLPFSFELFDADLRHIVKPLTSSLEGYYTEQIIILEEQQREGTAGLYRENRSILKMFRPNALLSDVNFRFLESFEYWLRNVRKNKDTSISVKMRNLQRVINQAIEDKLLKREDYPFGEKKYSVNKRLDHTTKKIAIHTDNVTKLKALCLKEGSAMHFAQQICLFSYFCRGMNFIDMTFLRWDNVTETHIEYKRRKTGSRFQIPLNSHSQQILAYFRASHKDNHGYVFPIIDPTIHITTKQQYTRKKTALKAVNDNLKQLAKMIKEPTLKLSTNVLRHTYATGLKRSGAQTSYITEALGHATEFQTQTYLDSFERGAIESWENKMFDL